MSEAARQCQNCRHWQARPGAGRGACILGEIGYPWCFNSCGRYLGSATAAPAPPVDMQSQARGFWPYVPGVVKP
jgi:hypothetical protein